MTSAPRGRGTWLVFALLTAVVTGVLGWWLGERQGLGAVDDAYISLRYAENWATGKGLSFNPGERVEGYSNFLLVVLEAACIRLGVEGPRAMVGIGWLSLGLLAGVTYGFCVTYVLPGRRLASGVVAVAASLNLMTVAWAASGLETCLYTALVVTSVGLASSGPGRGRAIATAGILFLAALTRWEALALVPLLALGVGWRGTRRDAVRFAATFVLLFGVYFAVRWAYFSHPLPNTFYAKLDYGSGALTLRGARYVGDFALAAATLVVPAALALVFWRAAPPWMRLTVAVVMVQLAVVVYEGGDHFALFRFLVPTVPFLSMLAVFALGRLGTRLPTPRGETVGIGLAVVLMLTGGQWVGRSPHRDDDEGRTEMARFQQEVRSAREWSALGRWFRQTAPSQASLATIAVGAIGYYSGLVIVDPHGVIDPEVAHQDVSLGDGYAGHEKYDVGYVLSRRPDYVLVLNYITGSPVPVEDLPMRVWGDFNRQILQDGRFLADYRLEAIRLTGWATLNLHVRADAPIPGQSGQRNF